LRITVSSFEIPARDPSRAARFYREAFGWAVEPVAWDGPAHFRVRASVPLPPSDPRRLVEGRHGPREGIDGGLTTAAPGDAAHPPDHPLVVLHVEGIPLAACLARVVAAGGAVDLPAHPVGTFGSFARFRDPDGNILGLWQAS
jgi:predicted enzyme related to lactoylglutathione lyase